MPGTDSICVALDERRNQENCCRDRSNILLWKIRIIQAGGAFLPVFLIAVAGKSPQWIFFQISMNPLNLCWYSLDKHTQAD